MIDVFDSAGHMSPVGGDLESSTFIPLMTRFSFFANSLSMTKIFSSMVALLLLTSCATVSRTQVYLLQDPRDWKTSESGLSGYIQKGANEFFPAVSNYDCTLFAWGPIIPFLPGFLLPKSQKIWSGWKELTEKLTVSVELRNLKSRKHAKLKTVVLNFNGANYEPEQITDKGDSYSVTFPISLKGADFKLTNILFELEGIDYSVPELSYSLKKDTHFIIAFFDGVGFCQ